MENFQQKLESWIAGAQKVIDAAYGDQAPTLIQEIGKRYIRIVRSRKVNGQVVERSAYAFIDTTNGNVLKPDGWKGPAKHARGNILDEKNGLGMVGPYGMESLR